MIESTNKTIFRKDENGKQKQNKYKTNSYNLDYIESHESRKQQNSIKTSRKYMNNTFTEKSYLKY